MEICRRIVLAKMVSTRGMREKVVKVRKKGMRLTFIFASILSRSPKKERDWGREEGKNKMTDVLTRAARGRSKALQ